MFEYINERISIFNDKKDKGLELYKKIEMKRV